MNVSFCQAVPATVRYGGLAWARRMACSLVRIAGCRLRRAGCKLRTAGCKLRVAGGRWRILGCELQVAGCKLQAAGCRLGVPSAPFRQPATFSVQTAITSQAAGEMGRP